MTEQSQSSDQIRILTDEEERDSPGFFFESLRNVLVNVIQGSSPRFSIGIFGDWGTGKTTLMRLIEEKIADQNGIEPVWFNAWRYEREEQFAIIPLLKTIAFALPNEKQFESLKQKLKIGASNFLKKTPDIITHIVTSIASKYLGEGAGDITEEVIESFRQGFNSKLELLAEVDRNTLYFDGIEDIKKEIQKLRENNSTFSIVVFVDDLDRCSPERALAVFESVKVFLDIEGFIFVIGLSITTIARLIEKKYKDTGIKGEDYIRKIIQIPIFLPTWKPSDIVGIVDNLIRNNRVDPAYADFFKEEKDILETAVEPNPREIKRFINNFMIASKVFSSPNLDRQVLLLNQALQLRWDAFYQKFASDEKFRAAGNVLELSNF
jgi:predicted KAP-like P-loop ATPase